MFSRPSAKTGNKRTAASARTQKGRTAPKRPQGGIFSFPDIDFAELTGKVLFYLTIAAWGALFFSIFLIASIFSNWTGSIGRWVRELFVGRFGGGILVPLFFMAYLCISAILRRRIPRPVGQLVGTVLLYFCTAFVLGLFDMVSPGVLTVPFLYPGITGRELAVWAYENIGPLGTTLAGLGLTALTTLCFGFTAPFASFYQALRGIFVRPGRKREKPTETADAPPDDDASSETPTEEAEPDAAAYIEPLRNLQSLNGTYLYESDTASAEPARPVPAEAAAPPKKAEKPEPFCAVRPEPRIETAAPATAETSETELELPSPVEVTPVDEIVDDGAEVRAPVGQFPPPLDLYGKEQDDEDVITQEMARPWGERIIDSLAQFGIEADLAEILLGPTVIQFRIQPLPGVKVNKIVALANDLAMALAVSSLRVEAPIPGKPYVGIEIPNPKRKGITLRTVLAEDEYQETEKALPLPMGVTINGDPLVIGMEELPHLLVAGTTGSGKSVFVNSCIVGLCSMRRPDELKMVLVDPKRVEMAVYEKLPHLLTPPVTDPKKAVHVLGWAVREMERRYSNCAAAKVRNLASYNEVVLPKDRLPHIVIVVDELADLMMTAAKEVEDHICRLAQMARAVGIHLMLATQRPSVNVITGLIKANVPARVAFTLPSMMDSRTILDTGGAEKLLGKGDMLFTSTQSPKPLRIQSPWIDEHAILRWLDYLVTLFGEPDFTDIEAQGDAPSGFEDGGNYDDALLEEAVKIVVSTGMASASGLQRRLRVGFTRAGRLVDMMEMAGIVGPADGARPREILVDEDEAEEILARIKGNG